MASWHNLLIRALALCVLLHIFCGEASAWKESLNGYKVFKVTPETSKDVDLLRLLEKQSCLKTSFWTYPTAPGKEVHVMVSGETSDDLEAFLKVGQFRPEVMIKNVQKLAEQQVKGHSTPKEIAALGLQPPAFDYGKYHSYDEISNWTYNIIQYYNNTEIILFLDNSFEGRTIPSIYISSSLYNKDRNNVDSAVRPALYIQGGMHAREWISPATVMYMTAQLLRQYGKDPTVTTLLDTFDWFIIPLANPDGYDYAWKTDRLWRKTRANNTGSACVGVDPNRNFGIHFGEEGASKDPCTEDYIGPYPFSTNEIETISNDVLARHQMAIKGFIDFHSYGQEWMTPFAFTKTLPKNYDTLIAGCKEMVAALKAVNGTEFECGTIAKEIGEVVTGSSVDWAYTRLNFTYSYGVELRDQGTYGFLLPADQIIPSGNETFAALKAYGMFVKKNLQTTSGQ